MKILLVEDDEIIRPLVVDMLGSGAGIPEEDIVCAQNGAEGWARFQEVTPDVVITDMMMPEMDGAELIRNIRSVNKDAEIVVMTAYADLDMAVDVIKRGVYELIRKPFKAEELTLLINKIQEKFSMKKETEEFRNKLIQAEKLSSVGLLAAGIAHEINNPNTFVKGNIELLKKYWELVYPAVRDHIETNGADADKCRMAFEKFDEVLDSTLGGSERIRKIVSGLLSFSRSSNGEQNTVKTHTLIEEAKALTLHQIKHLDVQINIPDNLKPLHVNEQDILQVVMNLLVNASDAIVEKYGEKSGGMLAISAEDEASGEFQSLRIQDNGTGIPDSVLAKLYDPFFTTKPQGKGTGLGLSISRGNVESNGGQILCESSPGEGATFTLRLPTVNVDS